MAQGGTLGVNDAIVVNSSRNVGIGLTSLTEKFEVNGSINTSNQSSSFTTGNYRTFMDMIDSAKIGRIGTLKGANTPTGSQGSIYFTVNGATEAVLDNNGALLVGKTIDSFSVAGATLNSGGTAGKVQFTRSGQQPLALNRLSNDGVILGLYQAGTQVGSINSYSGDITIGTGDTGVRYDDNANALIPWNITSNTSTNGTIALGASNVKFTDLHLSGTANVGLLEVYHATTDTVANFESGDNSVAVNFTAADNSMQIATSGTDGIIKNNGAGSFRLFNNGSEKARIDSIGRLGIGTSSPSTGMHLSFGDSKAELTLERTGTNASSWGLKPYNSDFFIRESGTDRITFKAGGNVGIGTTSPSNPLDVAGIIRSTSTNPQLRIYTSSGTGQGYLIFGDSADDDIGQIVYNHNTDSMRFHTNASEKARIDSSGNILVAQTSQSPNTVGISLNNNGNISAKRDGGIVALFNRATSDGEIISIRKDDATVGSIGSYVGLPFIGKGDTTLLFDDANDHIVPRGTNGGARDGVINLGSSSNRFNDLHLGGSGYFGTSVGIGTASPARTLHVNNNGESFIRITSSDTGNAGLEFGDQSDGVQGAIYQNATDNSLRFNGYNNAERARIDSSGNFLVGKTSTSVATVGGKIAPTGEITATVSGDKTLTLNRTTNDGTLIQLRRDNTAKAQIGVLSASAGNDAYFASGSSSSTGTGLRFISVTASTYIGPCRGDGTLADDLIDLGSSGARFDDIYATNGTIQTSDRNEKQDIQELSDAEQRVATACKGLIRRYKFNKAVTEKGDDARYHFGIIAQDLQDAFATEGLDAGDYGMFIADTYTDDNGIEQTRLGVRYNELLAFIIATL